MEKLRASILRGFEVLDPDRQSVCWPDPIAWDGRPLPEIATSLCAVLEAEGTLVCCYWADKIRQTLKSSIEQPAAR
jgi:hypothetical protein